MAAMSLANLTIRTKLLLLGMLASGAALLLATTAFVSYEVLTFRKTLVNSASAFAEVVGLNSASAVLFNDPVAATRTLSALKARPSVISAAIYSSQGTRFASWSRDAAATIDWPARPAVQRPSHRFVGGHLQLFHPIVFDGADVGTVFIESDLQERAERTRGYLKIAFLVLALSVLLATAVSAELGRRISDPILNLVATAEAVSLRRDYSVRASPAGHDEIGLLIHAFNDMLSQIRHRGEALQQAHDDLEKRVEERTAQLTAANKELEAFSYSVSHDLRTPLRAIDGFSRELLDHSSQALNAQGQADLRRIRTAAQRMAQLIDDLLKLSRLTRSEMTFEAVDLSTEAHAVIAELQAADPTRQVQVTIEPGLLVRGDRQLLRVALENLLQNAWKFTRQKTSPTICLRRRPGAAGTFYVKDNGAGFNTEYAGKLFGAFQRLHDASEFPGTGIGLATVQRVIRRHGGTIWANAAVERGATFYFTLPVNPGKELAHAAENRAVG
jgi:signal transduction histidine kinase